MHKVAAGKIELILNVSRKQLLNVFHVISEPWIILFKDAKYAVKKRRSRRDSIFLQNHAERGLRKY